MLFYRTILNKHLLIILLCSKDSLLYFFTYTELARIIVTTNTSTYPQGISHFIGVGSSPDIIDIF